jgi:very-short-patch-repair endonuclease
MLQENRVRAMRHQVDRRLIGFARSMRKDATDAESSLWARLRAGRLGGLKFRRQVPIGSAIADFVCYDRHLIIELDGSQHADSTYDRRRDAELRRRGFRVLRIWNGELAHNLDGVLETIRIAADGGPLAER